MSKHLENTKVFSWYLAAGVMLSYFMLTPLWIWGMRSVGNLGRLSILWTIAGVITGVSVGWIMGDPRTTKQVIAMGLVIASGLLLIN